MKTCTCLPLMVALTCGGVTRAEPDGGVATKNVDKESLRRVIHQHWPAVRRCYERALLGEQPAPPSRLVVEWDIDPSGEVDHVHLADASTSVNDAMSVCVMQAIAGWRFPRLAGAERRHISYSYFFCTRGL